MKLRYFLALLFFAMRLFAQDRIYLQDGTRRVAKVLEITPDEITIVPISESGAPFINAEEKISRQDIVLIEYKNGEVQILNTPTNDVVNKEESGRQNTRKELGDKVQALNLLSLNCLGLFNSDISGFYEHLTDKSLFGFGMMAAYNFNKYASLQNNFISTLNAAKKQYDLGAFVNLYPTRLKRRNGFFIGIMLKYTAFTFSRVTEISSGGQTSYKYSPAQGSQLATMVTIGNHRNIGKNLFIRNIVGIGAFNLRGDYKEQYNYQLRTLQNSTQPGSTATFRTVNMLPKIYFGLNIGYRF